MLEIICDNRTGEKLELIIPVKNEEKRMLSVLEYYKKSDVLDLVIFDDNSTDASVEIAIKLKATVYKKIGNEVLEKYFVFPVDIVDKPADFEKFIKKTTRVEQYFLQKKLEQSHLMMGFFAPERGHDLAAATRLLSIIWGENMFRVMITTPQTYIWLHNDGNADHNTLFGDYYPPSITFVLNSDPTIIKKLCGIGLKTDGTWDVNSIIIPPSVNYPTGMQSQIPDDSFSPIEEYLWSSYLGDETNIVASDPELDTADKALVNGRDLIGSSATHKMTATQTGPVRLFSIKSRVDLSPKPR